MTVSARKPAAPRGGIMADGWALLPLRLVVGFGFAAHGYAKLARGPESFAAILQAMDVPAPGVLAWVTSVLEFLGGICVMASLRLCAGVNMVFALQALRRTRSAATAADQLRDHARTARDPGAALPQSPECLDARIVHPSEVREVEAQLRLRLKPQDAFLFQERDPFANEIAGDLQGRPAVLGDDADHSVAISLVTRCFKTGATRGGPLGRPRRRSLAVG